MNPPPDPIYRIILWVLVADVVIGACLALAGEFIWPSDALRYSGAGLAVLAGLLYLFFRWLGRRAGRREWP
ncbi:MAG: hypothetical protein QNJ30_22250 [Kiloniellales bacterium]|nr:hypothetical protein [Kiloniellales bacterium]